MLNNTSLLLQRFNSECSFLNKQYHIDCDNKTAFILLMYKMNSLSNNNLYTIIKLVHYETSFFCTCPII